MKKQLVLFIFSIAVCSSMQSQALKTVKHYYGFTDILYEVYTVIEGTGTKHGNYKRYDRDGFLLESATFKKNVLNGQYIKYGSGFFVERGKAASKMNYLNGKEHGEQFYYSGQAAQGEYYLDKKQVFNNGELVSEITYYENGKKKSYEDRSDTGGKQLEWHENGNKKRDLTVFITDNGRAYNDTSYFENGSIEGIQVFDDTQSGTVIVYYENGKIKSSEQQKKGTLDGEAKMYRIDGTLEHDIYFSGGVVESRTTYSSTGIPVESIKLKNSSTMTYDCNTYDSISRKLISESERYYTANQYHITNERIYEEDGGIVVKDYLNNTVKRFDINNVLVFEQNKEGDRMSYEYTDSDTIIRYWSDNDDYIYKQVMKDETRFFYSDGKSKMVKYDDGLTMTFSYQADGYIATVSKGEEVVYNYYDMDDNLLKVKDDENNILVFYESGKAQSVTYEITEKFNSLLTELVIKKESLVNKMLYVESYEDGAVKSIGCFDTTGRNKVEYWYFYDSGGNLTKVEKAGAPLRTIRKSHTEKGKRLLVVIQDVIKSISDKMFFK